MIGIGACNQPRERGIPGRRGSTARVDHVPALCTHRPSLLPIERSGEVLGSGRRRRRAACTWRSGGGLRCRFTRVSYSPRRSMPGEDDRTRSFRGSKSRNKVSVGEPAEGSLSVKNARCFDRFLCSKCRRVTVSRCCCCHRRLSAAAAAAGMTSRRSGHEAKTGRSRVARFVVVGELVATNREAAPPSHGRPPRRCCHHCRLSRPAQIDCYPRETVAVTSSVSRLTHVRPYRFCTAVTSQIGRSSVGYTCHAMIARWMTPPAAVTPPSPSPAVSGLRRTVHAADVPDNCGGCRGACLLWTSAAAAPVLDLLLLLAHYFFFLKPVSKINRKTKLKNPGRGITRLVRR